MSFSTLLFTYIFGGLTFLPLLIAAVLIPAWRSLPQAEAGERVGDYDKQEEPDRKQIEAKARIGNEQNDGAAGGTFAVLRQYDFQSATAALNARSNAGSGGSTNVNDGTEETASTGESVYQSVYRSVFDRNKHNASTTSILEKDQPSSSIAAGKPRKTATPVNVFYVVLRHGHLMLYGSAAQIEVRHVISLAHHTISLSSGEGNEEADMKDGDLFIKRTAIVLTAISNNHLRGEAEGDLQSAPPKRPFYLFSPLCIEKEDFYHALLSTRDKPPIPQPLDTDGIIKLQSTLHSTNSLTPETRALNALISRLFLALHHTDYIKAMIRNRIEKKISRVQKPAFIASLAVRSIDLGDAAPVLTNPRLKDLNISGDMTISCDVRYTGCVKVAVSALARLDLGPRFKTRTADLLLSISVTRLHGHVLLRIKPPPSNRVWFCFESIPEMEIKVEPIVQSRQITYTFILRAIEDRIRSVVGETLVKPNWDDLAFFDSREQSARGGIWLARDELESEIAMDETLSERNAKTKSMPSLLVNDTVEADLSAASAASSGSESTSKVTSAATGLDKDGNAELKHRSVTSLPVEGDLNVIPPPPAKPVRSPSLASPSASVASVHLDESSAKFDPSRTDSQSQSSQSKGWRLRPTQKQWSVRKDAIEAMREMRDRTINDRDTDDEDTTAAQIELGSENEDSEVGRSLDSASTDRAIPKPTRSQTNVSTTTASSSTSARSQRQQEAVQKGRTFLLAAGAATNAARNWSWNQIQNRTKTQRGAVSEGSQEPIGRGQPLPPPGQPLPGPQKSWLPSGVGMGSVKRKPLLPPRRATQVDQSAEDHSDPQAGHAEVKGHEEVSNVEATIDDIEHVGSPTSDDFGPWRENSGAGLEDITDGSEDHEAAIMDQPFTQEPADGEMQAPVKKKIPPPLPARPQARLQDTNEDDVEHQNQFAALPASESGGEYAATPNIENESTFEARIPSEQPDLGDRVDQAQPDERSDGTPNAAVAEEPLAIPAPVEYDANEIDLEAEGIQRVPESILQEHDDASDERLAEYATITPERAAKRYDDNAV